MTSNAVQDRVVPYWNEENIHGIPRDVMIAAEYSLKEARAGRCIPNSEVKSYIAKKRGWK